MEENVLINLFNMFIDRLDDVQCSLKSIVEHMEDSTRGRVWGYKFKIMKEYNSLDEERNNVIIEVKTNKILKSQPYYEPVVTSKLLSWSNMANFYKKRVDYERNMSVIMRYNERGVMFLDDLNMSNIVIMMIDPKGKHTKGIIELVLEILHDSYDCCETEIKSIYMYSVDKVVSDVISYLMIYDPNVDMVANKITKCIYEKDILDKYINAIELLQTQYVFDVIQKINSEE